MSDLILRGVYSGMTLYMMLILVRWLAPWLEVDLHGPKLRWLPRAVDPLINLMRRILPAMGPMDFGPLSALLAVWLLRVILVERL